MEETNDIQVTTNGDFDNIESGGGESTISNENNAANVESATTEETLTEEQAPIDEKNTPFHKHPRWIEQQAKLKEKESELSQLKQKVEELTKAQQTGSKQEIQEKQDELDEDLKDYVESFEKDIGNHQFPEKYDSWQEFYKDMARRLIRDISVHSKNYQKSLEQKQSESQKALQDQAYKQVEEVKAELGDRFDDFKEFANRAITKATEQGRNIDLISLATAFSELSPNEKKAITAKTSRVATSNSKPTSKVRSFTAEQIAKYDMATLAQMAAGGMD